MSIDLEAETCLAVNPRDGSVCLRPPIHHGEHIARIRIINNLKEVSRWPQEEEQ